MCGSLVYFFSALKAASSQSCESSCIQVAWPFVTVRSKIGQSQGSRLRGMAVQVVNLAVRVTDRARAHV